LDYTNCYVEIRPDAFNELRTAILNYPCQGTASEYSKHFIRGVPPEVDQRPMQQPTISRTKDALG